MSEWKNIKRTVLCHLFYGYLKCLEKTVEIKWIQPDCFLGHHVVGFWHEDSFVMNLVLRSIVAGKKQVDVLVTGDARGDYIQYMIEKCGGRAVRIGYGFCNAGILKDILKDMKDEDRNVAIAMDGPLGPRHIPKKLTSFLSEKTRTELVGVTLSYSKKLTVKSRWDHYRIPLPFSTIIVRFDNYGVASSKEQPRMRHYQDERRIYNGSESCLDCGR